MKPFSFPAMPSSDPITGTERQISCLVDPGRRSHSCIPSAPLCWWPVAQTMPTRLEGSGIFKVDGPDGTPGASISCCPHGGQSIQATCLETCVLEFPEMSHGEVIYYCASPCVTSIILGAPGGPTLVPRTDPGRIRRRHGGTACTACTACATFVHLLLASCTVPIHTGRGVCSSNRARPPRSSSH